MRELNFFSPYLSPRRSIKVGQLQVVLAIVFIFLICGSLYSWNIVRIVKYSLDIKVCNDFMTDPANIAAVKNYSDAKQKVDIIQQYTKGVEPILTTLETKGTINSDLINKLSTAIPHEIYLDKMSITQLVVTLTGTGKTRDGIAQYQRNLSNLGVFADITINVIEKKTIGGSDLIFTADCILEGGASNEVK